jgi:hypothetical protein
MFTGFCPSRLNALDKDSSVIVQPPIKPAEDFIWPCLSTLKFASVGVWSPTQIL